MLMRKMMMMTMKYDDQRWEIWRMWVVQQVKRGEICKSAQGVDGVVLVSEELAWMLVKCR